MKVFLEPPNNNRGIMRVRDALVRYAPASVEVVKTAQDADLEVIHVYGRHDAIKARVDALKAAEKPYAMIQYAIRSTQKPSTQDWYPMWKDAKLVWSYYDLMRLDLEDSGKMRTFPFYYAPLGVESSAFHETKQVRDFIVATSSHGYLVESVRECIKAAQANNQKVFYLGKELNRGKDIECKTDIPDWQLANYYSRSIYVSGLRRIEGFELPVIEGALCGARPIVFDKPHYRKWFDNFAVFIPEGDREQTIEILTDLFKLKIPAPAVSEEEKEIIRKTFNWDPIIKEFWNLCVS